MRPGKNSLHTVPEDEAVPVQVQPDLFIIRDIDPVGDAHVAGKNFVNAKEKMYDHFPLTVHQMDIIIGVLFALIALFLVLGVTHTSFFGLFEQHC